MRLLLACNRNPGTQGQPPPLLLWVTTAGSGPCSMRWPRKQHALRQPLTDSPPGHRARRMRQATSPTAELLQLRGQPARVLPELQRQNWPDSLLASCHHPGNRRAMADALGWDQLDPSSSPFNYYDGISS